LDGVSLKRPGGNRQDDEISAANCVANRDRSCASLRCQIRERFGSAGIGYCDLVSQRGKPPGKRATDVARADNSNFHLDS
jgi:hypothetical protein